MTTRARHIRGMTAGLAALAVSACAPQGMAPVTARGPVLQQPLTVDGAAFVADVVPGAPGQVLTAAGAQPVAGHSVVVRRSAAPLANTDGAVAKRAARDACAAQGLRFDARAIGAYAGAGAWRFAGACA